MINYYVVCTCKLGGQVKDPDCPMHGEPQETVTETATEVEGQLFIDMEGK